MLCCRAMSVCVIQAGRGRTANKKLMNVCPCLARTTPPAQTFSTATSMLCYLTLGHSLYGSHQKFNKCIKRSCLETAVCPSTDTGDNELQMAGKINGTINGSQHERVSRDLGLIGEESQWCSFSLCPTLAGDTKVLQVEKLVVELECNVDWLPTV